jgi:hypothetical protein
MGGFAALMTAASDPDVSPVASIATYNPGIVVNKIKADIAAIEAMTNTFETALAPLQGAAAKSLVDELLETGDDWNLIRHAKALAQHSVLLIGGSRDQVAPMNLHHTPIVQALKEFGTYDLADYVLDADHAFSDKRIDLSRLILSWLEKQYKDQI